MPSRESKSDLVSCAHDGIVIAITTAAAIASHHIFLAVRMYVPLEIEVKTNQQFTGVDVGGRQPESWPGSVLVQPVVLVVPGESGTTGHKRVIAVADGVGGDVAKVGGRTGGRLLRHPDRLVPPDEDELRAVDVVRLDEHAIPGRRS